MTRRGGERPEMGEADLAAQALLFLAEDPDRLGRFLSLTGLDVADLRKASRSPGFTGAVLTHLMEDEALLIAFASWAGLSPQTVATMAARHRSPLPDSW